MKAPLLSFGNRKFAGFLGAATVVIIAEYVLVLSDCVIAGRMLGESALGAMNLLQPVFAAFSFFTWLLAEGTSIAYSEAIGRADGERASRLAGQGLALAAGLALALALATQAVRGPYLAFMAPDGTTAALAEGYWRWYPATVALEAVDLTLLYLTYADGGRTACLVSYVGQVAVNVAASCWLCRRTGMAGVSLGTALAYVAGLLVLLPRLRSARCGLRFRPHFDVREALGSLRAAFGDASAGLFHALLFFVIAKYVLRRWGSEALAVSAVALCIVRLSLFFNGVGIALQPLETVYHGEENETAVDRLVRFAAAVAATEGLLLAAAVLAAPDVLVRLVGIHDPVMAASSRRAAQLTVTGLPGLALVYVLNSHLQFVGRPGRSAALTALAFFLFPALLLPVLGAFARLDGVWLALAIGPLCALMACLPLVRRPVRPGPPPTADTFRLRGEDDVSAAARRVREVLSGDGLDRWLVGTVAEAVAAGLRRIAALNPGRQVLAELTLDRRGCVKAILRDDGGPVRLTAKGAARCVHLPAAGFNRNILTWRDARRTPCGETAPPNYLQTYVLNRLRSDRTSRMFNLAKLFRLRRGIDLGRLSDAIVRSVRAHAALESVFRRTADGGVVQRKEPPGDRIRCPIVQLDEQAVLGGGAGLVRRFDVFGDVLFDAKIFDCGERAYLLSNVHHLVCDGYSFPLILADARRIYEGGEAEPDDYYGVLARREALAQSPVQASRLEFFLEKVRTPGLTVLPRPDLRGSRPGYGALELPLALPANLDEFLGRNRVTRHHLFLSATVLALSRMTQSDAVLVDWVFHGRITREELRTVGAFMIDLPLVAENVSRMTSAELVGLVKSWTMRGIRCARAFRTGDDCNPMHQDRLTFIYQDAWGELMDAGPIRRDGPFAWMIEEAIPLTPPVDAAENPFNVEIMERSDATRLFLEYDAGRYSPGLVRRYADLFKASLAWLLA